MPKSCQSCGAETFPGARFCRRCGAAVRGDGPDATGNVSPQAATVPLGKEEARTTDGLAPGEEAASPATSRVSRAEVERLLRPEQDAGRQKTSDANANAAQLDHDAGASAHGDDRAGYDTSPGGRDDPRATGEGAHDPEVTLLAPTPATRPDAPAAVEHEEELTVNAPRPARPLETRDVETDFASPRPAPVVPIGRAAQPGNGQPVAQQTRGPSAPARTRRKWPFVAAAAGVVVLVFAVAAAWLAVRLFRRPQLSELPAQTQTATPAPDAVQQFDEKLAQAEALLAQGNMDEAVARLHEANALDPSNTRAHRRLGELLLASGARRDAIEEFRAVTRNAPEDFTAWRQLATAQFAEGLYRDASESYRRLVALVGEQSAEAGDLLSYADALRLSGRADEARAIYQRLSASSSEDVASTARQRLAELAQAQAAQQQQQRPGETGAPLPQREGETASLTQPASPPQPAQTATPAPQPTPTPVPARAAASTPSEHYQRGVELWSSSRAAAFQEFQAAASGGNVDANYYLGLYYVEGKDVHNLDRASLLAGLRFFQLAGRGGQHAGEARRYAQQLEREYDNRLRRQ